eukprot:NODE_365_length_8707_cov_1.170423.p1 type:complete len:577 gc:universal NODE_365_length_8707_cov_1.170423:2230-500(-)
MTEFNFDSLIYVSRYLTIHDILNCSGVCKSFNLIFNHSRIWKELLARDFDVTSILNYKEEYIKLFYIYHTTSNGQYSTSSLNCPAAVVTNTLVHRWIHEQVEIQGLIATFDEPIVQVYKMSSLKDPVTEKNSLLHQFNRFGGGIWALAAIENILCLGSTDRNIHVVDLSKGQYLSVLTGHAGTIRCLSVNIVDYKWILVSGSRDKNIKMWDLSKIVEESKSNLQNSHEAEEDMQGSSSESTPDAITVSRTNVSRRRSDLASAMPNQHHFSSPSTSPQISSNDYHCLYTLEGHNDSVRSLSCTSKHIVSASYDRSARIWDYKGKCLQELVGHQDKVYAVVCDDKFVWTGSLDNSIRVWEIKTGQCLYTLDHNRSLVGIIDKSNRYVVSASADSSVTVFPRDFLAIQEKLAQSNKSRKVYGMYGLTPFKATPINNRYLPDSIYRHSVQNAMFGNSWSQSDSQATNVPFPILHQVELNLSAVTCMAHNTHFLVVGCDGHVKLFNIQTGEFIRDIITGVTNVWRVKLTDRHLVVALSRNQRSEIIVLDFYVPRGFPVGMNTIFRSQSINNMDDSSGDEHQ